MTDQGEPLPGPSAERWTSWARLALLSGVALLLVLLLVLGLGARPGPVLLAALALLPALGFATWLWLGRIASQRMLAERDAGYSTVVDADGYDLRDGVTGALLRSRDIPPERPGPVGSFLLGNLRVRPGTWAASRIEPDRRD